MKHELQFQQHQVQIYQVTSAIVPTLTDLSREPWPQFQHHTEIYLGNLGHSSNITRSIQGTLVIVPASPDLSREPWPRSSITRSIQGTLAIVPASPDLSREPRQQFQHHQIYLGNPGHSSSITRSIQGTLAIVPASPDLSREPCTVTICIEHGLQLKQHQINLVPV